jgi:cation:H+ antiporter
VAAARKQTDISIGNIIGSNIFNILAILGVSASIKEINITEKIFTFDIWWMLGISVLLFLLLLPMKGAIMKRWKGILLAIVYLSYIYLIFVMK